MRDLKIEERQLTHGGCVLTPAIVTGVLGIVAGTIWLTNSMVDLYIHKSAGRRTEPVSDLGPK